MANAVCVQRLAVTTGSDVCFARGRSMPPRRFVYILKSRFQPQRYYTGVTSDVDARLADHNRGGCIHTATGRPWAIDVIVQFADEPRAVRFEQYLKSGSGVAFAMRHLR
jgi:putative endonuclease